MTAAVTLDVAATGGALRALLDDIAIAALSGDDPQQLVANARDLADALTDAVLRLEESDEARSARLLAAHLAAGLAVLENTIAARMMH